MKLKVKGMHCKACEMLIRDILEEGTKKATSEAQKTMGEVREKLKL